MLYNTVKTFILMFALGSILIGVGNLVAGQEGMLIAFIIALLLNGFTYFFSDKIVLRLYKAKPLDPEQYRSIHADVATLAARMQMPMPKLWLVPSPVANAFATGRNPKHASVALTTSIIELLEPHELQGVLAHELSHVKNRDILIGTMAATLATAISYVAYMLRNAVMWGSYRSSNNRRSNNPITLLIVSMIMPLAATLIQLAISRSREFQADDSGAHITQDPLALASALQKLEHNVKQANIRPDERYAATSSLCIVKPFSTKTLFSLFATHPPMRRRIERLHKIHEQLF